MESSVSIDSLMKKRLKVGAIPLYRALRHAVSIDSLMKKRLKAKTFRDVRHTYAFRFN